MAITSIKSALSDPNDPYDASDNTRVQNADWNQLADAVKNGTDGINTGEIQVGSVKTIDTSRTVFTPQIEPDTDGVGKVGTGSARFGEMRAVNFYGSGANLTGVITSSGNQTLTGDLYITGTVLADREIEANTAGSGAPNVLAAAESLTVFTNEGTSADNYHTLPTAVAGYQYSFIQQDATYAVRVTAASGDTIRIANTVSPAAGYIESAARGSAVTLVAINATEWVALSATGSWTVST